MASSSSRRWRTPAWLVLFVLAAISAGSMVGCAPSPIRRTMSLRTLTAAPPKSPAPTQRFIVSDAAALQPLLRPLGQRMGLIQVRTEREWQQLRCAVPQIGCCPELKRGIVVGLATSTGTPLDPTWPFVWERIRLHEGAGLLEAHFHPGNYLADDTMYLETAYVQDLVAVLVVSLDGVQYYPE